MNRVDDIPSSNYKGVCGVKQKWKVFFIGRKMVGQESRKSGLFQTSHLTLGEAKGSLPGRLPH